MGRLSLQLGKKFLLDRRNGHYLVCFLKTLCASCLLNFQIIVLLQLNAPRSNSIWPTEMAKVTDKKGATLWLAPQWCIDRMHICLVDKA